MSHEFWSRFGFGRKKGKDGEPRTPTNFSKIISKEDGTVTEEVIPVGDNGFTHEVGEIPVSLSFVTENYAIIKIGFTSHDWGKVKLTQMNKETKLEETKVGIGLTKVGFSDGEIIPGLTLEENGHVLNFFGRKIKFTG